MIGNEPFKYNECLTCSELCSSEEMLCPVCAALICSPSERVALGKEEHTLYQEQRIAHMWDIAAKVAFWIAMIVVLSAIIVPLYMDR